MKKKINKYFQKYYSKFSNLIKDNYSQFETFEKVADELINCKKNN